MNRIQLDKCPIEFPSRKQCAACNNYNFCNERKEGIGAAFYLIIISLLILGGVLCISFSI